MFAASSAKKIRWLVLAVIAFDMTITLAGQPHSFWHDPRTANEANGFFAWFLTRGTGPYVVFVVAYLAFVSWLLALLPQRPAGITAFAFLFSHYYGASTWLMYRFHMGMAGPILYAVVLSIALAPLLGHDEPSQISEPPAMSVPPPAEEK